MDHHSTPTFVHFVDLNISYATYVPFEGPVAVLLKVIGPKPLMTVCAFCWAAATLGMSEKTPLLFIVGVSN